MVALQHIWFALLLPFYFVSNPLSIVSNNIVDATSSSTSPWIDLKNNDTFPPSIRHWQTVSESNAISLLSLSLRRGTEGSWYIPHRFQKYSSGWNRTVDRAQLDQPYACNVQLYGLAYESNLHGFIKGGTGYLQLQFHIENGKLIKIGFDTNETKKIHCYYMTSKDFGSEFIDTPKTLGIIASCPITLDMELGEFSHRHAMVPGHICRAITEYETTAELTLRPTHFNLDPALNQDQTSSTSSSVSSLLASLSTAVGLGTTTTSSSSSTSSVVNIARRRLGKKWSPPPELPLPSALATLTGKGLITPTAVRQHLVTQYQQIHTNLSLNAVCAVQTFRNPQSGPMLFLFVKYYLEMGWHVIVYDRFGYHTEFLEELFHEPGFHYHDYTIMQIAQPSKYNDTYAASQGFDMKYFYKMEKNWGYVAKRQADTADQDQDKTRTYDYCRIEYAHFQVILYIDTDEFFYCPQSAVDTSAQREYQQALMNRFYYLGVEEMRFVRLPYGGYATQSVLESPNRTDADLANHTNTCMSQSYESRNILNMFQCWSSASAYDDFPKSADFASKCPFHYNHWSCDGMRGGGRDHTLNRCRCKVSFDMMNGYEFRAIPEKCHLIHLNDNKYRFQSRRMKHSQDKGSLSEYVPLVTMLQGVGTGQRNATHEIFTSSSSSGGGSGSSSSQSVGNTVYGRGDKENMNRKGHGGHRKKHGKDSTATTTFIW